MWEGVGVIGRGSAPHRVRGIEGPGVEQMRFVAHDFGQQDVGDLPRDAAEEAGGRRRTEPTGNNRVNQVCTTFGVLSDERHTGECGGGRGRSPDADARASRRGASRRASRRGGAHCLLTAGPTRGAVPAAGKFLTALMPILGRQR